jgi:RimJ/RimL family protein N-acetyltransferase
VRERAKALIEIAHPDFRAELLDAAKRRRFVFPDQIVSHAVYPFQESRSETLRGGEVVLVRPLRMSDEMSVQRLLYSLSDESTYRRFFGYRRQHPHEEMQAMVDLDYENAMGLVVCDPGGEDIIGLCRYDVDPATRLAEIAFIVRDDWQGKGVGTLLLRRMIEIARDRGLTGFRADVLTSNRPMLAVFHKSDVGFTSTLEGGVVHLVGRFEHPHTDT